MKLTSIFFSAGLAFVMGGCSDTPLQQSGIGKNHTGDITLKCYQEVAPKEMKYLFTAKATLNEGVMTSWVVNQQSLHTLSIENDFALTLVEMSDKSGFIKTRSSGHEISTGAKSSRINTMYITDDLRTGLFANGYAPDFYFYCSPKI